MSNILDISLLSSGDHYLKLLYNDLDCNYTNDKLLMMNLSINSCKNNNVIFQNKINEETSNLICDNSYKLIKQLNIIKNDSIQFFINNPNDSCRKFTPLEQAIYSVCNKFNITYTITTSDVSKKCISDFLYTITTKNLSDCVISAISITSHIKKCEYDIIITEKECNTTYKTLIEETKSCNLTFKQYQRLISEGWTPLTISTLYSNDFSISPDSKSIKYNSTVYSLDDICFSKPYVGSGEAKLFLEQVLKNVDVSQQIKDEIISS